MIIDQRAFFVRCDCCDGETLAFPTEAEARAAAARDGWIELPHGGVSCPPCLLGAEFAPAVDAEEACAIRSM